MNETWPTTKRRDTHCIVVCGICGHESIGDKFVAVWSNDVKDAWYQYKLHRDAKHPEPPSSALREFAEFVVSLDDVAMRTHVTLSGLIHKARKALDSPGALER